jgi:catechol 2,3-dioxygenase-like lactoylglutathione lyase family enzyme
MAAIAIVVDDLDVAVAFFRELGRDLAGTAQVDGVHSKIAMVRTPDGRSKLELTRSLTSVASRSAPADPPPNTLGAHRVIFAVDDIDDTVVGL